ncbi:MAG: TlpA family protein disulfide reductase [Candidatus Hydrogenedentes bacterium]|nr:TlpA family protein disulfide reductase [Candidatus Hydrogenedentota bacterium]
MRKIVTLYHSLIAALLGLYVALAWALLALFGRGAGLNAYLVFGPLYVPLSLLVAMTVLFLPAILFCTMRAFQRSSRNPDRFRRFPGLPALARVFSLQGIVFAALLLTFETPWADILETDWAAAVRQLVEGPKPRALPPDSELAFPQLPLAQQDPFAWAVKDLEGNEIPIASFKGNALFLNFWATWCPPCRAELPNIQRMHDAVKDKPGISVLLISSEEPEQVKQFMTENGYTFPCYLSKDDLPFPFAVSSIPTTFLVAPDGAIALHHVGPVAWDGGGTQAFLEALSGAAQPAPMVPATPVEPTLPVANTGELAMGAIP